MTAFIEKDWLLDRLNDSNVVIVDCRFQLSDPEKGKELYLKSHIKGANYLHMEDDLSGNVEKHGGRHPLPKPDDFKKILENAGISNDNMVVAYDGGEGSFAGRLWWLLKFAGHQHVYILNGGYKEWTEANYPIDDCIPTVRNTHYEMDLQSNMLASVEDVRSAVTSGDHVIIDSREQKRYLGIEEPIDKKAGHIPTAVNYVWTDGFKDGKFKSAYEQERRFADIDKDAKIIVYCGSGITATPNYIALKEAGYENVKLYGGSFSDWISYDEHEVETKLNNEK
ncbi:sulfurtransferase [Bacillus dakarensis]|uniref:sulfurtransferase n=1 Tax=Robertmurraya dakarensis TaxID=1926278 RepID=UPI0009822CC7|nr:sulfurtransferase [Bacillus dakarensis]